MTGATLIILLFVLLMGLDGLDSAVVSWQNDSIELTFGYHANNVSFVGPTSNDTLSMSGYKLNVTVMANGPLYEEPETDEGHFLLKFYVGTASYGDLSGSTETCIPLTATQNEVKDIIAATPLSGTTNGVSYDYTFTDIVTGLHVQKYRSIQNTTNLVTTFLVTVDGDEITTIVVYMRTAACTTPRTYGHWNDASKWSTGEVPTVNDSVWLPETAGVIYLDPEQNVMAGLTSNGGHIIGHHTVCPRGWISNPNENPSRKCYRMFETQLTFDEAENFCQTGTGKGSMDAHLVQIANAAELLVTQRLCRGHLDTITTRAGCWIGLRDPLGIGSYEWIQHETVINNTFRDWRRYSTTTTHFPRASRRMASCVCR